MTKEAFKKKWENYWFYYKIHTIVAIVVVLVLGVMIKQCSDRVIPDTTVLLVSNTVYLTGEQLDSLGSTLSKYTEDTNHDGRKVVVVDQYYFGGKGNSQMNYALTQKLGAQLSTTDNAVFLLDDSYYNQFNGQGSIFAKLNTLLPGAPEGERAKLADMPVFKISGFPEQFQDLTLSLRSIDTKNKTYQNNKNMVEQLLKSGNFSK